MGDTVIEERAANPKAEEWVERIAAQQRSGISVKQFCKEQGLTEYSFYAWRKRLQEKGPVRFALVERRVARQERATEAVLELVLASGCGSARAWIPPRCARFWKSCGHDPFAGQRSGVSVSDGVRHAQEF